MAPISLQIESRSGKNLVPGGLEVDAEGTVDDLKKAFHAKKRAFYPSRQRFSFPPKQGEKRGEALADGAPLSRYGLRTGSVLQFKDLGPQIGYSTVFFWEYFGPMAVYPLFFLFPKVFYPWHSGPVQHGVVQQLAMGYWIFHYLKRILETFFVHRFSHGTMPIFNLFKNCSYYWGFAAFVSYFVNHPHYTAPTETRAFILFPLALLCQWANYRCHVIQRNLRAPGEKAYKIPKGFLFNYITCANYTAEIFGWVLYGCATQTVAAFVFVSAGAFQMGQWAAGKHRRLQKTFDGKDGREKYPRRWKMIPFLF
ncbi:hypothetical protein BSKO_00079 [Bryopsis sp. KO-2023]|nr:hypothetical protein BSKO_00079 [Bryopsis sp. KO-2023]